VHVLGTGSAVWWHERSLPRFSCDSSAAVQAKTDKRVLDMGNHTVNQVSVRLSEVYLA